jgi:hypothetical protein
MRAIYFCITLLGVLLLLPTLIQADAPSRSALSTTVGEELKRIRPSTAYIGISLLGS